MREVDKRAAIVTVSDSAYDGAREDLAGPALAEKLIEAGFAVIGHTVVPDERSDIAQTLRDLAEVDAPLVVTTGGTGLGPRDVTPEATQDVVFAGTVREWTRERRTLRLEYHAYDEMAIAKLREVTAACQKRWPIDRISIWHRVGVLEIGEISLLVGVSTPHRKDAYTAAQFAVDMLKRIVPIWKKEWYADGQVEWVGPDGPWNPVGEERTP